MIAKLKYFGFVAFLPPDGKWVSSNKILEVTLNTLYSPRLYPPSPAAGSNQFSLQAVAAGRELGVPVEWIGEPDLSANGRVY